MSTMTRYTEFRSRGLSRSFLSFSFSFSFSFFYDSLENTALLEIIDLAFFVTRHAFDRVVKEKKSFTRVIVTLVPCETNYPFILSFCSIYIYIYIYIYICL